MTELHGPHHWLNFRARVRAGQMTLLEALDSIDARTVALRAARRRVTTSRWLAEKAISNPEYLTNRRVAAKLAKQNQPKDHPARIHDREREVARALNPEYRKRHAEANRRWRLKNSDKARAASQAWKANNPEYKRERYANNVQFKLAHLLRNRLKLALKNGYKRGSAVRDLSCSISELISRLETLFEPGMTWENQGKNGWELDHVIPLACFDLTDRDQLLRAVHYTNLQPLWAADNAAKRDNLERPNLDKWIERPSPPDERLSYMEFAA